MDSIIHLENIIKAYFMGSNSLTVLKGLSLDIYRNEYVALMGPSGSGKSTLMNIIGCLDTPSEGTYILNGSDVSKMSDDDLAEVRNKEIGFVFQQFNLLPRLTAAENVALPLVYAGISKKERTDRAMEALNKVGLSERSHHKPNEMSGGQIQRVAIARALVNNPSILLADEPTGNLDKKNREIVFDIFKDLAIQFHQTILVVTHDLSFAQNTQRVIEMKDGQILK